MTTAAPTNPGPTHCTRVAVWSTLLIALIALAGSLWLSLGMNLKACPLCFYQRTFVMAVVAVLAVGLVAGRRHRGVLPILAFPLALAAFAIAAFHVYLELAGKLECPRGVWAIGTAPQQSAAILAALLLSSGAGTLRACRAGESRFAMVVGAALGLALAAGAIASAPPLPPPPANQYDAPPEICRSPWRAR